MPKNVVDVRFPLGGVDRRNAYQSSPPYTCADAKNVWPRDSDTQRMRGGSRPGLSKTFNDGQEVGPYHLLSNLRTVNLNPTNTVTYESFLSPWNTSWLVDESAAALYDWPVGNPNFLSMSDDPLGGRAYMKIPNPETENQRAYVAAAYREGPPIDATITQTYILVVKQPRIFTDEGSGVISGPVLPHGINLRSYMFIKMTSTDPVPRGESIVLEWQWKEDNQGGDFSHAGTLRVIQNWGGVRSVLKTIQGEDLRAMRWPFYMSLTYDGDGNDTVSGLTSAGSLPGDNNDAIAEFDTVSLNTALSGSNHSSFGFGFSAVVQDDSNNFVTIDRWEASADLIQARYTTTGASLGNRNRVCIVTGVDQGTGSKAAFKAETTTAAFAEPSDALNPTNTNSRHLQAVELLGRLYYVGEDLQELQCYSPFGNGAVGTITQIDGLGSPHNFIPAREASPTEPETDCTWIAAWRNRLVIGGKRTDPQDVWMSRSGAPQDWEYGTSVGFAGAAVYLSLTGIDSGKMADPINCGIAHSDDYLILGGDRSLHVLRGDPTLQGQIDRLSDAIGIVSAQAWARGPNGETIFLSHDGLYHLPAGVVAYPESVSREKMPDELRNVDTDSNRVLMGYDTENRGVFIGVTHMGVNKGGTYFWLDWEHRGFWPMEFPDQYQPTALAFRNGDAPNERVLMLGCRDGYIREFNRLAFADDGIDYDKDLLVGPIHLGGNGYEDGMLLEVIGQLGLNSGEVTCEVQVGDSAESARFADPRDPITLRPGKNVTSRPRLRGNAAYIKLSSNGAPWSFEQLTLVRERLGKQRLL